ncbi:MAG TPA: hypothetical protein VK858_10645 [Longimicrobiales bacterium]|nr:hypothetical protein [Longimicrobiales bacterium]
MNATPPPPAAQDTARPGDTRVVRRAALEFVVISVGVLAALSADAGWGWFQERGDEREALAQLLSDFQANSAKLDSARWSNEASLDASYDLLALATGLGDGTAADRPDILLNEMLSVWTYNPDLGGLNSLIASGRLGIIRDDRLRVALAAWPDLVEDLAENEREEWDHSFEVLQPYFVDMGVRLDILRATEGLERIPPAETPPDVSAVLRDPRFAQMTAGRIRHLHDLLAEMETVHRSIDEIIELLSGSDRPQTPVHPVDRP